jgi:hypothetical protein
VGVTTGQLRGEQYRPVESDSGSAGVGVFL